MSEIIYDEETGLFDAISPEGEVLYDGFSSSAAAEAPQVDVPVPDVPASSSPSSAEDVLEDTQPSDQSYMAPYAVIPDESAYTPAAWQVNLAAHRALGEHYVMYAHRVSTSTSYRYWRYYLILGDNISYQNEIYQYKDCEVYSYYDSGDYVTYEVVSGSGSVDGSQYLVYSDLYFDYVAVPAGVDSYCYIFFALFFLMFVLILVTRRK